MKILTVDGTKEIEMETPQLAQGMFRPSPTSVLNFLPNYCIYSSSTDESNMSYLTVYLQIDGGFCLPITTAGNTFVCAGVVNLCVIDGESGGRLVVAKHADIQSARLYFLTGWSEPVNFLGPTNNYNPKQMNISAFMS